MTEKSYAKSIELPQNQIFRNLKNAKTFAIDIGGSLAKIAYYCTVARKKSLVFEPSKNSDTTSTLYDVKDEDEVEDRLHFIKFETKYIEVCLDFIIEHLIGSEDFVKGKVIKATGGGAHKYIDLLTTKLGVIIDKEDEMECLIRGCNFLLKNIPDEAFLYHRHSDPEYVFQGVNRDVFPYLLVNIGSGVSILKVESEEKYERVGGTSMGGGTFWGLGSLVTKAAGFDELLELAEKGDHRNIDMLVKDIYGGAYAALGLPPELIASSFGKAARSAKEKQTGQTFSDADIAKSLLIGISNDIGQLAYLQANLHGMKNIYFGGYFIRGHPMTMHTITYAINYWSKGSMQALFLRHEGYLGAIGAFLKSVRAEDSEKYLFSQRNSWQESFAWSSGLQSPKSVDFLLSKPKSATLVNPGRSSSVLVDTLELYHFSKNVTTCPLLLDSSSYQPDTVDLTQDAPAREYWLQCFEDAIDKFTERMISSQPDSSDAVDRAEQFKQKYITRIHELKLNPASYGPLTVRSLLDMREQWMEGFHFTDPYSKQKQLENEQALEQLKCRLETLEGMTEQERILSLVEGLLAGNVFDWGAKEVAALMKEQQFGFAEAMSKLQKRPWLFDDFERWAERLSRPSHKCAAIFCDNSGIDIILGIIPFAWQLIKRGTKVILCANSKPALNDVTYSELIILMKKVRAVSPVIDQAVAEDRLLVMESGQGSPCLDLRYIDDDLCEKMKELETDLVVLEGMGRAVHTNFYAMFSCEVVKIAVLKNNWLANRLGGKMFDVMFKYEKARKIKSR